MQGAGESQVPIALSAQIPVQERVRAHLQIARLDHSVKQIFILPGIVVAISLAKTPLTLSLGDRIVLGLIASTLIACSNYVINEVLDAPFDRLHPTKRDRPAARGVVHTGWAYFQWIAMMAVGLYIGHFISTGFVLSAAILWVMGCVYNIPPVRSKDVPYLDVLSESVNNPLRFCLGWYIVAPTILPPASLLISYWMLGSYFMALKRFSEFRQIQNPVLAAAYRRSFRSYTEESLLTSVLFYGATAMLFFGAFLMRYRLELVLCFPLVAWLMMVYFNLAFQHESSVQNPEKLYKEPRLMVPLLACIAVLVLLSFIDLPMLANFFPKSVT